MHGAIAAGALSAIALCLTFAALAVAPVALGVGLLASRSTPRLDLVRRAALLVGGLVLTALVVRALLDINLVSAFRVTLADHRATKSFHRPYAYWVWASIPAFLTSAGVALSGLAVAETWRRWRARRVGFESVLWGTLAVSSLSGVFVGEVDQIWLFFVPLLAAVAGSAAAGSGETSAPAALGLAQAITEQAVLYTFW